VMSIFALFLLVAAIPVQCDQIEASGTKWCSDHAGNNFLCSDGPSGEDKTYYQPQSPEEIGRSNASGLVFGGNLSWDKGDYEHAADMYRNATIEDPNNAVARGNLSEALNKIGIAVYAAKLYPTAWTYFTRAVDVAPASKIATFRNNAREADSRIYGNRDCNMCGKAIISDVGYGLDNSRNLLSYANQAGHSYKNCTNRINRSCTNTSGKSFDALVKGCAQTFYSNENALRVCLRQAWKDAQ